MGIILSGKSDHGEREYIDGLSQCRCLTEINDQNNPPQEVDIIAAKINGWTDIDSLDIFPVCLDSTIVVV